MTRAGLLRSDSPRRIVLGVGGGIAAYKICEVLRRLTEVGHQVRVVPTEAALKFVGAPTWEALSGLPVHHDVFAGVPEVLHVRLGQTADLVLVAPATADLLARAAHGRADDLLCATLLTARCPVLLVPAMHTEMWEHPRGTTSRCCARAEPSSLSLRRGGSPVPIQVLVGCQTPPRSSNWPLCCCTAPMLCRQTSPGSMW